MLCDGISGTELLGMAMVLSLIVLVFYIQFSDSGASRKVDFSWLFLDTKTGKVTRAGLMGLGGFLLGVWVIVDSESKDKLDWTSFGVFLAYCAGVVAIKALAPQDDPPEPSISKSDASKKDG